MEFLQTTKKKIPLGDGYGGNRDASMWYGSDQDAGLVYGISTGDTGIGDRGWLHTLLFLHWGY